MPPAYHPCPTCRGTGRIELTGVYAETLAMLRQCGEEITGAALARQAGCKATAMNNRLARLEAFGLAVSRWYGRKKLYRTKDG